MRRKKRQKEDAKNFNTTIHVCISYHFSIFVFTALRICFFVHASTLRVSARPSFAAFIARSGNSSAQISGTSPCADLAIPCSSAFLTFHHASSFGNRDSISESNRFEFALRDVPGFTGCHSLRTLPNVSFGGFFDLPTFNVDERRSVKMLSAIAIA